MRQWYCHLGGQQYGPVAEDVLRTWAREGRVKGDDLVWTTGMAQWVRLDWALPDAVGLGGIPGPGHLLPHSGLVATRPAGTGGRTLNYELTAQARAALRGRWDLPIAFCLLLTLLSVAIQLVPYAGGIAALVVAGPLQVGAAVFFLSLVRGQPIRLGMMFEGFHNFANALGAYMLMAIFVFLWTLLLIVPGIIAAFSYSQTYYLLADDYSLGPLAAIRKSKEMMRGHKWRLFCLGLRFLGWALLCVLTLGIGFLWLWPYMWTGYARFYDDLHPPRESAGLVGAEAQPGPQEVQPIQPTWPQESPVDPRLVQ